MGSFYGNVTLLGVHLDDLREAAPRPAFAAVEGDDIVLFAAADDEGSPVTGPELSSRLGCTVFSAAVHDDDIFFFEVHQRGDLLLSGAIPDPSEYFDLGPDPGETVTPLDPGALVAAIGRGDADAVAQAASADFLFATERHEAFVRALGLPGAAVGWGHRYLTQDGDGYSGPALTAL